MTAMERLTGKLTTMVIALLSICFTVALSIGTAAASKTQLTLMRDDRIVTTDDTTRNHTLDYMRLLGVDVVQIMVNWHKIAPSAKSKKRPSSLSPSSPSSYPAGNWAPYDAAVRSIQARDMEVMLNPTGAPPRWASTEKSNAKFWHVAPDPKQFAAFAQAVGKRYNGSYSDSNSGGTLPKVSKWGIWNEPNVKGWLIQARLNRTLGIVTNVSAHIYRSLYLKGTAKLRASGHSGDDFFVGDTSPLGFSGIGPGINTRPAKFWREFFCLDGSYHSFFGIQRSARGCPSHFPKIKAFAVSHHPYTRGGSRSPYARELVGDLPIARTNALVALLNKAATRGRISKNIPIWFTEYGLQTMPPDKYLAVSLTNQARFINEAERLGYKNSRVKTYTNYEMVDDPLDPDSARGYGGFQSGLRFQDGRQKPSFDAFRLPIVVTKTSSSGNVIVWGAVRPKVRPTTVQIEAGSGGSFSSVGTAVSLDSDSRYFERTITLSGARSKSWRLKWIAPDGTTYYSRSAKPISSVSGH